MAPAAGRQEPGSPLRARCAAAEAERLRVDRMLDELMPSVFVLCNFLFLLFSISLRQRLCSSSMQFFRIPDVSISLSSLLPHLYNCLNICQMFPIVLAFSSRSC